jgi:hypothetical protein
MNRFQKVVKVKTAPSDDLDFPKGPQIQGIFSIHEGHFSSDEGQAFHGLQRRTFDSPHFSITKWIRSVLSVFIELGYEHGFELDESDATELHNAAPKLERE